MAELAVGPRQPSLLAAGAPRRDPTAPTEHIELGGGSWLDHTPGWLIGADQLFEWCLSQVAWTHGERLMYDRFVAEPRLTASLPADQHRGLPPVVEAMATELTARYDQPLHRVFASLYRDGSDSVAWHGDRIGRVRREPTIPVLSLGGPRTFALRPQGGGQARHFEMHSGDLLVMGGSCQHRFEHSVPKRRYAEPRISLTFRHETGREAAAVNAPRRETRRPTTRGAR